MDADKYIVQGELCPGWTRDTLIPTTTQEWKNSIEYLTSYFRIHKPLRKLNQKEALLITAQNYNLTQARKNVILTALHRASVLGSNKAVSDIQFEELFRGKTSTIFEIVKSHKRVSKDSTGELFGGDYGV